MAAPNGGRYWSGRCWNAVAGRDQPGVRRNALTGSRECSPEFDVPADAPTRRHPAESADDHHLLRGGSTAVTRQPRALSTSIAPTTIHALPRALVQSMTPKMGVGC